MNANVLAQIQSTLKTLGVKADEKEIYEKINAKKLKLIWLHFSECTGCSESFIRSESIGLDDLIFDFIDLIYHETYMAASGFLAEDLLEIKEPFLLVVEGAIASNEFYTSGAPAHSALHKLKELTNRASCVYAVGSCSSYGGIQAAKPNPTNSISIEDILKDAVLIPGCPPSESNIIASILHFAFFDKAPTLDDNNRPAFAYSKCLHDMCERKIAFESGEFVEEFGDEAAKSGACLFKVGCKGPYTFNNCPKTKFNAKTSWPVQAGHGCIACSERDFWDNYGVYEQSLASSYAQTKRARCYDDLARFNKSDEVVVKDDGIYINNELSAFLEFESKNHAELLNKNKLGAKLLANYKEKFGLNLEGDSEILNTFSGILISSANILGLKLGLTELLDLANKYEIGIASGLDFKLAKKPILMDVSKSFRLILIYRLGGLDDIAILFGVVDSIASMIAKSLKMLECKSVKFEGELFKHQILIDRLNYHLKNF
ncbi:MULTISPECIES: hydrogenase small subunit [unclassified Campylobacter]|uniref:hydrogenase small subunit n=1 Tax=unclassified Campylobacter TaxID=2593542 RepID=UPI001BD9E293|nr:hydrogenase small subunit [Campylobacter sp. 2018MI13]MBT0883321.1 hydrogenase small subunit [Campylobacter sp. 2018MI13]MBZ7990908.1 hydrogenase small subunit [Campylobacter sp. RM9331]MBZ8006321.1 hydrogenase small subunit [Campylobacter sp. RM9332]